MEKNYSGPDGDPVKLAVKALLEVVQLGAKNLEVAVMKKGGRMEMLPTEEIEKYCKEIEEEKEKEAAAKKKERGAAQQQKWFGSYISINSLWLNLKHCIK